MNDNDTAAAIDASAPRSPRRPGEVQNPWAAPSRRGVAKLLAVGATSVLLSACGTTTSTRPNEGDADTSTESETTDFSTRFAAFQPADEPNGDLTKVIWPEFVTKADPEVKRLYEFQITHGELMRYIPCFCGCGRSAGHRSNRDCYVQAVNPDGSVVLDAMAPT